LKTDLCKSKIRNGGARYVTVTTHGQQMSLESRTENW